MTHICSCTDYIFTWREEQTRHKHPFSQQNRYHVLQTANIINIVYQGAISINMVISSSTINNVYQAAIITWFVKQQFIKQQCPRVAKRPP
jgi:hypothetical protein